MLRISRTSLGACLRSPHAYGLAGPGVVETDSGVSASGIDPVEHSGKGNGLSQVVEPANPCNNPFDAHPEA